MTDSSLPSNDNSRPLSPAAPPVGPTSTMTPTARDRKPLPRALALGMVVVAVGAAIAGPLFYRGLAPRVPNLIDIELGNVRPHGHVAQQVRDSLVPADLVFILCYGVALLLGAVLALYMSWTKTSRLLATFGLICSALAMVTDFVEDIFLANAEHADWLYDAAGVASTIKWSALVPGALTAMVGVLLAAARLVASVPPHPSRSLARAEVLAPRALDPPPPPEPGEQHSGSTAHGRWAAAYCVPGIHPDEWTSENFVSRTAVCLSGGGVRSATVALGAIQALRKTVVSADYLISVSGGGYTSGALLQAITGGGSSPDDDIDRDPERALAPGSVSEDHIRRHSSYIASSVGQMMLALLLLARGLLASLFVLFSGAVVIGVVVGIFYHQVPITNLHELKVPETGSKVPFPTISNQALIALAVVGGLALLLWMYSVVIASWSQWQSQWVQTPLRLAMAAAGVSAVVALFVIGFPVLSWFSCWIYTRLGAGPAINVGVPVIGIGLSYFGALTSTLWKSKAKIVAAADGTKKVKNAPKELIQLLYVILLLSLLGAVWLLIFGVSASTHSDANAVVTAAVIAAGWLFIGGLVDETALSLHPFYRRRLACAFAVRTRGGVAEPYDPAEPTSLPEYGRVDPMGPSEGLPEFVFAASANLSDDERTAPGLRAVSYTMGADYIGGPDVGWMRTQDAIDACPPQLKKDLTVQAAVAISGAAFASAMGRASTWYETLLAVTGARLGSWLPHPDYLLLRKQAIADGDWTLPGLPHVRRFSYLLREVFGVHPYFQRLLHVTDGGHYENLGLVEALRRRCELIYVFDSSGDTPPSAATLAEAIRLARDELGVDIVMHDPWALEPGSGMQLDPTTELAALNARLSATAVVIGTIKYPAESGLPENCRLGLLVFAKSLLWGRLPYDVLSYAIKNPQFPHDTTADQWFTEGQFSQYKALGRELARSVAALDLDLIAREFGIDEWAARRRHANGELPYRDLTV